MRVLVTGASGFVGKHLCNELYTENFNVTAVVRQQEAIANSTKLVVKTLTSKTNWLDELEDIDVVIHLAGRAHVMKETVKDVYQAYAEVNVDATKRLAQDAANAGVKRFIFLSSIKVNGEATEDIPFSELSEASPEGDYGKTKLEAESILHEIAKDTDMDVVIIRPPLVYGKGVKANFKNLIKLSQSSLPLPFGAVNNKRSLIYIENLISFIMLCIDHPRAANQTFLVSDDDDVSLTELIKSIAEASKNKALLVPLPVSWLVFGLKLLGKRSLAIRLFSDLQVDISKAKKLLNWQSPYSFKQGITKTLDRY